MVSLKNDKKQTRHRESCAESEISGLIGVKWRKDRIRERTGVFAAVSFCYFFLRCFDDIRAIHSADAGQCHNFGCSQSSFVSDRAAGLGNHLPGVTNVADTSSCNVDI